MAVSPDKVPSQAGPARRQSHLRSAGHSPSTTRAGRQLGSIGAKQGPGYSPYARRTYPRDDEEQGARSPVAVASTSAGLVSLVKALPGKALGFLWKRGAGRGDDNGNGNGNGSGSALTGPHRSQSLANLADVVEPTARARPLPRSSSTAARLGKPHERIASPALSTASAFGRSPSPTRTRLAGSMSAFNLAATAAAPPLPDPSASSAIFGPRPSASATNQFGLKSRSPFVGRSPASLSRLGSPGARSVASSTAGGGLFPYTSTIPRGHSSFALNLQAGPPQSPGQGTKRAYSDAGGSPPRSATYARFGSPLNPFGAPGSVLGGPDERARKKQLVWDPDKGLVSRETLEREAERAREARPVPKNEAERILEVLEGMGRTPMGEAKRAFATKPKVNVPTPAVPYARREPTAAQPQRPGTGLNSVFRAREERRQAERERERQRREDDERALRAAEDHEDQMEMLREEAAIDEARRREDEDRRPRRKTRSMVNPPTPASRETPATRSKKGKGRAPRRETSEVTETADDRDDVRMDPPAPAPRVKSPRISAKSPPPVVALPPPPSPPTTAAAPAPPEPTKPPIPAAASSLRPGRTHTSRTHVSSSKVFSAREEDLPPVDDEQLSKIKMPTFPVNFSFAPTPTPAPTTAPASALPTLAPVPEKAADSSSIFGRVGAAPPASTASTTKPAPVPSFQPSATTSSAPPASLFAPAAAPASTSVPSTTASDFFAKPSAPLPNPLGTTKPSFFSSVLDKPSPPVITPAPSFAFGAPPTVNPTDITTSSAEPAANPFAIFGKPIVDPPTEDKPAANGGGSMFGPTNGASQSLFGQPEEKKANGTTPSLFGNSSTPAPTVGLFGTAPVSKLDSAPSPFAFGAAPTASSSLFSAPKPTADAVNPFAFGSTPAIVDDADEDSGMEDETPAAAPAPKPFAFVSNNAFPSASATPSPVASANGAPNPFSFGAAPAGAPTSLFGGGASTAPALPSLFGSTSAAPVAPSPFGATSSAATFGAAPAASPFGGAPSTGFGFGTGSGPTSPAPQTSIFSAQPAVSTAPSLFGGFNNGSTPSAGASIFGQASNAPFGQTSAAPSPFGQPSNAQSSFGGFGSSAAMSQTMSAPAFGAPASTAPSFGGSTSTFGAAPSTPSFAFGQTTAAATFGQPPSASAFTFGTPTAAGGATPSFAFGGASPAPFSSVQPPVVFGAGTGSQSVPGSPNGVGFSIGSGGDESQSPGKRAIRPLRRKK